MSRATTLNGAPSFRTTRLRKQKKRVRLPGISRCTVSGQHRHNRVLKVRELIDFAEVLLAGFRDFISSRSSAEREAKEEYEALYQKIGSCELALARV